MVNPDPRTPEIPPFRPWRHALTVCGAALVLGVAGYAVIGSAGCMAAIEVARAGTRMSVMVLMGVILVAIASERGGDTRMPALVVAGLGTGRLVTGHLHLSGILRAPLTGRAEADTLAIFLAVGVALSIGLAITIKVQHAYLIVILFVPRCLMPLQDRPGALLKYGYGAALGVLAAILTELAGLPDVWRLLLALACLVLGLRFITNPQPVSSAAMTAGVLLTSAPTPGNAAFRGEAVVLVIALILFLTLILNRVAPRPANTQSPAKGRRDT